MRVLVTGGCGYIGSHTCVELLKKGHDVIIVDDLSNSKIDVVSNIEEITGKKVKFYREDIKDKESLRNIFRDNKIECVIHFACYDSIDSDNPIKYYDNNLISTINLCEVMKEFNCKKLVFSSSASVYGKPKKLPLKENSLLSTSDHESTTKYFIERILNDLYNSNDNWNIIILRTFNPIGAHESGLIGEDINSNSIMSSICKSAIDENETLKIYGNDYSTPDGTCIRDYIHVMDVAQAFVKSVDKLKKDEGLFIYNVGSSKGYSIIDLLSTFINVNNVNIKYEIADKRKGDYAEYYSDTSLIEKELDFKASKTLEDMCKDAYNYVIKNK